MVRFTQPDIDEDEISLDDDNGDNKNLVIRKQLYTHDSYSSVFHRDEAVDQLYSEPEYTDNFLHQVDPTSRRPTNGRNKSTYLKHLLFIILVLIFGKYMPPPPSPHDSWNSFVTASTQDTLTGLSSFSKLVWYLISGFSFNLYQDLNYWMQHIAFEQKNITPQCNISIPLQRPMKEGLSLYSSSTSVIEKHLSETIVGQDDAIHAIGKILDEWNIPSERSSKDYEQKPLSILISGSDGVGKMETAKLLAKLLFQNCVDADILKCQNCLNDGILILNGADFVFDINDNVKDSELFRDRLTPKILEHVYSRNGSGAAVILNHIEDIPESSLMEFSHLIKQSSVLFRSQKSTDRYNSRWITKNTISSADPTIINDEIWLGNTIFIITTELGAEKSFELVRRYRKPFKKLQWNELQKIVQDDINTRFGQSFVKLVAPFWPLEASDLNIIVQKKIASINQNKEKSWKRIELNESVQQHLISPNVAKYVTYGTAVVFASKGASYLDAYFEQIQHLIDKLTFTSRDDILVISYQQNELELQICSSSSDINKLCYTPEL